MNVQVMNNETIIRFPNSVNFAFLQDFIDYINVKTILSKSKANDTEIDDLAESAQEDWWKNNKSKFIK